MLELTIACNKEKMSSEDFERWQTKFAKKQQAFAAVSWFIMICQRREVRQASLYHCCLLAACPHSALCCCRQSQASSCPSGRRWALDLPGHMHLAHLPRLTPGCLPADGRYFLCHAEPHADDARDGPWRM